MITSSRLFGGLLIVCVVLLALVLTVPASADIVAQKTSHLIGSGTVQDLLLDCTVEYQDGLYTYSYQLQYLTGSNTVHLFGVENQDDVAYTNSWNNGDFWNPGFVDEDDAYEVLWHHGNLSSGSIRTFRYQSIYGWSQIDVKAYASSGGDSADGVTYGMTSTIPEPSSFAGLAMAGFAVLPMIRRRRR